jgi:hypothetical protein
MRYSSQPFGDKMQKLEKNFVKPFSKDSFVFFLIILVISILGMIVLFISTSQWGIGMSKDSTCYISGARQLLKGNGYYFDQTTKPITQWPPLFSLSLAAIGLLRVDPVDGARILNTLLFGANVLVIGMILKGVAGSMKTAFIGFWLALSSYVMLYIHSMAWSEPLYIFLTLLGFTFLFHYLRQGKVRFLFYSSIFIAFAWLTRYAGISSVVAGSLMILLLGQKKFFGRLKDGALFTALSSFPMGLWLLRNHFVARSLTHRSIQFHAEYMKFFRSALKIMSFWVLPEQFSEEWRYGALIFFAAVLSIGSFFVVKKMMRKNSLSFLASNDSLRVFMALLIFVVCYLTAYVANNLFVNINTGAKVRYLAPVFVACLLYALIVFDQLFKLYPHSWILKAGTMIFVIFIGSSYAFGGTQKIFDVYHNGTRLTGRFWKNSETIAKVRTLPLDTLIYTNEPTAVYILTGRTAFRLPRKYSRKDVRKHEISKTNEKYISALSRVRKKMISQNGYLVLLGRQHKWYHVPEDELKERLSLRLVEKFSDGAIYQVNTTSN